MIILIMTDFMFAALNTCCLVGKIHLHTGRKVVNSLVCFISSKPLLAKSDLQQMQEESVFLCKKKGTAVSIVNIVQ